MIFPVVTTGTIPTGIISHQYTLHIHRKIVFTSTNIAVTMSEADAQPPKATEETPAEAPSATTEETPVDTPAADDQPAVTEVTEVTAAEGEDTPKEEAPKVEEKPKEEEPKKKEKPKVVKVVDYRTSKAGWVQKRSLIFKKWQRQYMSLDEEDSVLRWWKTENHTGLDSALYMKWVVVLVHKHTQLI